MLKDADSQKSIIYIAAFATWLSHMVQTGTIYNIVSPYVPDLKTDSLLQQYCMYLGLCVADAGLSLEEDKLSRSWNNYKNKVYNITNRSDRFVLSILFIDFEFDMNMSYEYNDFERQMQC